MSLLILIAQVSATTLPTDTSKINNDPVLELELDTNSTSLVCLELGTLNKTIIDLELGDAARAKVPILEEKVATCLLVVEQKDQEIVRERNKAKAIEFEYNREIESINGLVDIKDDQIDFYQGEARKYKRQKNFITNGS